MDTPTDLWVTCPRCGETVVSPAEVELRICSRRSASFYRFTCPICECYVCKPADESTIKVLMRYGTEITPWFYPAEWDEPHSGPPISWEDILEFHFALEDA